MSASSFVRSTIRESDLEFDHGTFDSAGFAAQSLSCPEALAAVIDHTLLQPDATREQVAILCDEAIAHRFGCVMVNPVWVSTAIRYLAGNEIPVGAVLGFPFGASLVSTLRQEASTLARLGAREFDMVLPIGHLKSGNHHAVEHAIRAVAHVAHHNGAMLKVVLETCMLTTQEKLRGAEIAIHAGADFIRTSTGFSDCGATPADVALMRGVAGGRCGIKASGSIRTLAEIQALLEAGANRIGCSASVAILREISGKQQ